MNYNRKDNLTDIATQIGNPSSTQNPTQSSNNDNSPSELSDDEVFGNDGTVITLNLGDEDIENK